MSVVSDSALTSRESEDTAGAVGTSPFRRLADHRGAVALTMTSLLLYLLISLTEYAQYQSHGYDLGIFDQAVRAYAHFRPPVSAVKGPGFDVLGDHFSPVIALLAPLYWVWDDPRMLLVAQAVLVALSVPIVYRIADRRLPRRPALLITGLYAVGWPTQALVSFDFHELAFAVPMLAAALDAAEQRRYRRVLIWGLALLLVKEDMGFVVLALAAVLVIRGSEATQGRSLLSRIRRPPKAAIVLAFAGPAAYLIATSLVIPALSPTGRFAYWQYGAIGPDLPHALLNLAMRPWLAVTETFTPAAKALTLAMFLVPLALIPLGSPYALICVPLLAERFFSSRSSNWAPALHYNVLPWLVLVVAFVDVAARREIFGSSRRKRRPTALVLWMLTSQVLALAVNNTIQRTAVGPGLISRIVHWNDQAVRDRESAVDVIPANVCVAADDWLEPYLTPRDFVTYPGALGIQPDFLLIDTANAVVGPSPTGPPATAGPRSTVELRRALHTDYHLVAEFGRVYVLRWKGYAGPSAECGPLAKGRMIAP